MSNIIVVLVSVTRLLQFMPLACKFWVEGFHTVLISPAVPGTQQGHREYT